MILTSGDMLALLIALVLGNTMLIISFRRIYVLERKINWYKRELHLYTDPTIWDK
jgi:hypothetical protein